MADTTLNQAAAIRAHDNLDGSYSEGTYIQGGSGTIRVNAGYTGIGQTAKSYVGKTALSTTLATTITLETVTTGKIFFITDLFLSHDTALVLDFRLQSNGVDIFRAPVKGDTAPVQMAGMETQPVAQSGQVVTLLLPAAAGPPNAYYMVSGIEQ